MIYLYGSSSLAATAQKPAATNAPKANLVPKGRPVNSRILMITAVAVLAIGSITMTAQAGVVGPTSAVQNTAQSLNLIEKTRRICRQVMRCPRFLQCHWEKQCYITADYPPERGGRR
jgi:hypothetical protein